MVCVGVVGWLTMTLLVLGLSMSMLERGRILM